MFSKQPKILCVNCGLCLSRQNKRILSEQTTSIVTLIAQWISPQVIAEDDCICKDCWTKAIDVVNAGLTMQIIKTEIPEEAPDNETIENLKLKKIVGHRLVCMWCGRSVMRRRHCSVLPANPTEFQLLLFEFIRQEFHEKNITANDMMCFSCWTRIRRKFQKKNVESNQYEFTIDLEIKPLDPEMKPSQIISNADDAGQLSESSDKEWRPSKTYTSTPVTEKNEKQYIDLSNYKRCADTSSKCIFKGCKSPFRLRVPDSLRQKLLLDNKLYVPKHCRICYKHLETNHYDELLRSNSTSKFTAEHMDHILSLLSTETKVNFDNVLTIEDNLFQYFFNMTKDNFINIFNDIPKLRHFRRSELGLAGLIMKYKNNDSLLKLGRLMGTPQATLNTHLKGVKKIVMARMAELEKNDQTTIEQNEPIIFTPKEVLDYFKSLSGKPTTVFCDIDKQNSDESD